MVVVYSLAKSRSLAIYGSIHYIHHVHEGLDSFVVDSAIILLVSRIRPGQLLRTHTGCCCVFLFAAKAAVLLRSRGCGLMYLVVCSGRWLLWLCDG